MMNMARLIETLTRHEGCVVKHGRHWPYKDTVGKLTTGYGRNITDKGFSEDEARLMLHNDIQEVINGLRKNYHWFDALDEVRQEVVINMAFNLGVVGFGKFRNTIAYISAGEFDQAASNMLQSKWAGQVHGRATELAEMMRTGQV